MIGRLVLFVGASGFKLVPNGREPEPVPKIHHFDSTPFEIGPS